MTLVGTNVEDAMAGTRKGNAMRSNLLNQVFDQGLDIDPFCARRNRVKKAGGGAARSFDFKVRAVGVIGSGCTGEYVHTTHDVLEPLGWDQSGRRCRL